MQTAQLRDRLNSEAALLKRTCGLEPHSDRLRRAADTVARLRPEVARFGITRLAEVTALDRIGIPVWMAIRPNSRTLAVSQGKGLSDAAAQASAIMEGTELAIAENSSASKKWLSAHELRSEGELPMPMHDLIARGRAPAADHDTMSWMEGFDLFRNSPVWVPSDAVALDNNEHARRYWQSSDGLASGNLLLEAVVHGICERIERDACVLWRFRSAEGIEQRCVKAIDLADDVVTELACRVESAGFELRLFDITSDVAVPTFFATISPNLDGRELHCTHFEFSSGSGCHPQPARAAIRAITEAAQTRVTSITGARDDFDPALYQTRLKPDLLVYLKARPRPGRDRATPTNCGPVDPSGNLQFILDRLSDAGVESVVVVPLAPDEQHFAVAKVLVPGLEHPPGDRRYRFGRRALNAMVSLQ